MVSQFCFIDYTVMICLRDILVDFTQFLVFIIKIIFQLVVSFSRVQKNPFFKAQPG